MLFLSKRGRKRFFFPKHDFPQTAHTNGNESEARNMESLWTKGVEPPEFSRLKGDRTTDVLIIGGGMAGVLCALKLDELGVDYLLVEGKRIGSGITKGTTAVLSAQHGTPYQTLIQKFGKEKAALYLHANLSALERFRSLGAHIPCSFEEAPSFLYSLYDKTQIEREAAAVRSLGFDAAFVKEPPLPFPTAGAVRFDGMAQFHPLKFLYGAAKGLNICENTFVTKLSGTTAVTAQGRIRAKKVIVATHFPFINRRGLYFAKLYQKRSFVLALENAPQLHCTAESAEESGIYLRNYKNLLIVGGGDCRTGAKSGGFDVPRAFVKRYLPNAEEKYAWANQDCVSLDGVPYIGRYSPAMPDVFVASGFNHWGMTTSMVAADLLTDAVLGRGNDFAPVFAPSRSMLRLQLFANLGATLLNFLTPTTKRCSHLGCALKWNAAEHSWDCPCHGSRFDKEGQVIDNPAMKEGHVD